MTEDEKKQEKKQVYFVHEEEDEFGWAVVATSEEDAKDVFMEKAREVPPSKEELEAYVVSDAAEEALEHPVGHLFDDVVEGLKMKVYGYYWGACPECGRDDLRIVLAQDGVISCEECCQNRGAAVI